MTSNPIRALHSGPGRSGPHPAAWRTGPKSITGFTIVEVLVALAVLSVGMLGLAGLQVTGLKNNHTAYLRTQATQLTYDMTDRIRSNPDGDYDMGVGAAATTDDCESGVCAASQLVGYDIARWQAEIAARLPGGQGIVCIDSTPAGIDTFATPNCDGTGNQFAVKIWWDENRDGTLDTPSIVSFQP